MAAAAATSPPIHGADHETGAELALAEHHVGERDAEDVDEPPITNVSAIASSSAIEARSPRA